MTRKKPLFLCAGLQSSGSTIVSWCFLQRSDMDGIFDARNDILPQIPAPLASPLTWCKITISSFRFSEIIAHYHDEGWEVHPVLVVRDVRAVFNSLIKKHYGSNGITAEEPPLRMRLRRFREDWELCRARGWPIVRYETLVNQPERCLRDACRELRLEWEEAMLSWPKPPEEISAPAHGSPTFRQRRGKTFHETVDASMAELKIDNIPPEDLAWMEHEFRDFNAQHDYPLAAAENPNWNGQPTRAVPLFENTRRHRKSRRPLDRLGDVVSSFTTDLVRLFTR